MLSQEARSLPVTLGGIALCLLGLASVAVCRPESQVRAAGRAPASADRGAGQALHRGRGGKHFTAAIFLHSGKGRSGRSQLRARPMRCAANLGLPQLCSRALSPTYVNEFMTPLPKGMSGIFVISENQGGFVEQTTPCEAPSEEVATRDVAGTLCICARCPTRLRPMYQRTMDSTWRIPAITGVFIRLKWSDLQTGPETYNDTILLREVDKAVANGKLYSIVIKSGAESDATPRGCSTATGGCRPTPVTLDWNEESASCTANPHDYGNPTDAAYRELYLNMLSHVASVLKQNSARWRSLAYVKLSGANSRSAENRLPNGCKAGVHLQQPEVGRRRLHADRVEHVLSRTDVPHRARVPGKSMSYSLIQDGFPRVNDQRCYLNETNTKICPPGVNTRMVGRSRRPRPSSIMPARTTATTWPSRTWAWGRSRTFPIQRSTGPEPAVRCRWPLTRHTPTVRTAWPPVARTSGRPMSAPSAG